MNVYIWHRIDKCTSEHHPEGGLVVVAKSLERAREIARNAGRGKKSGCDTSIVEHCDPSPAPDVVLPLAGGPEERVIMFPDSGCC